MVDHRHQIDHLKEIMSATFAFGRDTEGKVELRRTLQAAIDSLTREQANHEEEE